MTSLQNTPDSALTRRRFLKMAGISLGAVAIAASGVSCASQSSSELKTTALDTPRFII